MSYNVGIAISNQQFLETETREQNTMKQIFDAFLTLIDIYNIQDLVQFTQAYIQKMFGLEEGNCILLVTDDSGNLVRYIT